MEAIANPTHIPRLVTIRTLVKLAQELDGEKRDAVLAVTKSYLRDCIHRERYKASRKARGLAVCGGPPPEAPEPLVKDGILQVCNNCKFLRPIGVENEGRCLHGGTHETNTDKHFCNLFEPSLEALAAASNDAVCAAMEKKAEPSETPSGEEEDKEESDACCRDCWHFNDSRDWCIGHEMPTTADNGYTCPDFRPRPRFSPNPKKQEEQ